MLKKKKGSKKNEIKKLVSVLTVCAALVSSVSFTTFAAETSAIDLPAYTNSAFSEENAKVIAETDEYTVTWIPQNQMHATPYASTKYTIKNWQPGSGSISYGRVFTITANNTVYIDYDIDWTPSSNVSIGTYSKSSGFKTAITVSDTTSYGSIKIVTKSNPVDLSFAVKNNGSKTITVNGYYKI